VRCRVSWIHSLLQSLTHCHTDHQWATEHPMEEQILIHPWLLPLCQMSVLGTLSVDYAFTEGASWRCAARSWGLSLAACQSFRRPLKVNLVWSTRPTRAGTWRTTGTAPGGINFYTMQTIVSRAQISWRGTFAFLFRTFYTDESNDPEILWRVFKLNRADRKYSYDIAMMLGL